VEDLLGVVCTYTYSYHSGLLQGIELSNTVGVQVRLIIFFNRLNWNSPHREICSARLLDRVRERVARTGVLNRNKERLSCRLLHREFYCKESPVMTVFTSKGRMLNFSISEPPTDLGSGRVLLKCEFQGERILEKATVTTSSRRVNTSFPKKVNVKSTESIQGVYKPCGS
jgi:hypothetical protein